MRGKFLHNQVLIGTLVTAYQNLGARISVEHRCALGFIDLFVEKDGLRIAIEAEQSACRIQRDIAKARSVNAQLIVVVPNSRVRSRVERRLKCIGDTSIEVLTLGAVLQRLTNESGLKDRLNVLLSFNPKIHREVQ